jgi:hypothetical protein
VTRAPIFVGRRTDACEPPGAGVQVPSVSPIAPETRVAGAGKRSRAESFLNGRRPESDEGDST